MFTHVIEERLGVKFEQLSKALLQYHILPIVLASAAQIPGARLPAGRLYFFTVSPVIFTTIIVCPST